MGSTRLPGKVLKPIGKSPLLGHVTGRLDMLISPVTAIVATSTLPADNAIADWCKQNAVSCFRGSEQDVLDRYLQCAKQHAATHVVRLTADNPFTDMEELDRLIRLHIGGGYDYSHSFGQMPLGVGAEIMTMAALERSWREGTAPNHREHVNEYIQENPGLFRIGTLTIPPHKIAPALRLTVDTQEDYERACTLVDHMIGWLTTKEAIRRCSPSA